MKGFLAFPILLILLFGTPAFADFAAGKKAYYSRDYATALKEWEPLAEKGNVDAQLKLGEMYGYGFGVTQDDKTAFKWYQLAADQGNEWGQLELGDIYFSGHGVIEDYKTSIKWYQLAADQGNVFAQFKLYKIYYFGYGVIRDIPRAHMWLNIVVNVHGKDLFASYFDRLKEDMTPTQIEKAQKHARECVAKNYKGC